MPPPEHVNLPLFDEQTPKRIGEAEVGYIRASSILTPASGFMKDYDYTLNPYSGCTFGCTYCYAAFFAREAEQRDTWGAWVNVKENALELLRRMKTDLHGKTIYMSSVTDPYQPIEQQLELVRGLLKLLVKQQPRLVVQTRSHLVVRDIDLLRAFEHVRVNMTVTTDSERVRRMFEPSCPGLHRRLEAITAIHQAGVPTSITMTPLLPLDDPDDFATRVAATGVPHFVVQPFHVERGKFVAGTRTEARQLFQDMNWNDEAYRSAVAVLRRRLPVLEEGKEGFAPA